MRKDKKYILYKYKKTIGGENFKYTNNEWRKRKLSEKKWEKQGRGSEKHNFNSTSMVNNVNYSKINYKNNQ